MTNSYKKFILNLQDHYLDNPYKLNLAHHILEVKEKVKLINNCILLSLKIHLKILFSNLISY